MLICSSTDIYYVLKLKITMYCNYYIPNFILAFFHFPYKVTANLNSLPVEIHAQILSYLDPIDCLSYGKVCRVTARAAECNQVWKRQWLKLSKETPFIFINDLDQLSGTSASLRIF